jgi:phosphonate transport system permease protein
MKTDNKTRLRLPRFTGRLLISVVLLVLVVISIRVTRPDFGKLVTSFAKGRQITDGLLAPELLEKKPLGSYTINVALPVPCDSASAEGSTVVDGHQLEVLPGCANPRDHVQLNGYKLGKNADVNLRWVLPSGKLFSIRAAKTDADGNLAEEIDVRPITAAANGIPSRLEVEVFLPGSTYTASKTITDVFNNMYVTIFMALLATSIGTVISLPLSFLAASNITRKGFLGSTVYYSVRFFLNMIRSYEPLVMASIFALIVGFGNPFAGVLALSVVTAASLGKMFSESVESIDPGPIEALQASGATPLQVVIHAVIPQIVPDFLSFAIYHWDINVRISTIIGFVGGGGIGYFLSEKINTFNYSSAGTAILAIILVVWALDFLSAEIRKQFT